MPAHSGRPAVHSNLLAPKASGFQAQSEQGLQYGASAKSGIAILQN